MLTKTYRMPVQTLAVFAAKPAAEKLRLLLAAAVATGHTAVNVMAAPGGTRYAIYLDISEIEVRAVCPLIDVGHFDRQVDPKIGACMIFDREPGTDVPDEMK